MTTGRAILLAIRIGEASLAPARTAAWLARELGASVTILNVAVELQTAAAVAAGAGLDLEEVRERMVRDARARAEEVRDKAAEARSLGHYPRMRKPG
jgi:nucleotide-binding universal stress UspA family protein